MPPEPLPWDRKDFFKERKHERSDSLGSVARWRDSSSHHGSREFARWGSADFRRPTGHGKQGAWHMFSEESAHGYTPSRSGEKMLEDESCRLSSRGDGKYSRNSRENRGSYSQKDWKGHSWETSNGSPNAMPGRPLDVNSDQRSVEDMLTYNSNPAHSDFVNGWDQVHFKDQHDKMGSVNGLGTSQRYDRENSLGSIDWKPLKWTRSGSLSSRGSGFSHSSSSKSMGVDSNETKAELQPRNVTPVQSPSGDAVACVTSAAPSEETSSRKKPRLGWGEGLAKYEKKKVDGPDESIIKNGVVFCVSNSEPMHSLISNLADKSPRVTGSSDCASPATPSSVACSSSPGMEEKPYVKAANIDNDTSTLSGSPGAGRQNHIEGLSFNLEKLELNKLTTLGSSLIELLQSDDQSSVDSSFVRSTAMNKLLIWKGDILKDLEMTESEIDSLENELKSLKAESGSSCPCPAASSSLPVEGYAKPCEEQGAASNLISRPAPLQLDSSEDMIVEKTQFGNDALEFHAEAKDEDIDSPGTATSKFVEPPSLGKAVSPSDMVKHGECSGDLDVSRSTNGEVECSVSGTIEEKTGISACGDGKLIESNSGAPVSNDVNLHTDGDNILCDLILASNRESANRASEVINKLLPVDKYQIDIFGATNVSSWQNDPFIREKFAMRKRFLRFKERVITLKFRAFQHLWKEDIRLLSIRKNRAKSQKRFELSSRILHSGYQKHRSSIRSRFSSPAGNLSLVPTTEIINFMSKLLSDSEVKLYRNTLKMPALILDKKEKMVSRFISTNGLVEDPCAVEKERAMINPWMPDEKKVFMDKLATFGKDFRKIASFLDHRTTADCVEFYYKNHKSDSFEKIKKQLDLRKQGKPISTNTYLVTSGKRWNRDISAASLDMLGAVSVMASQADESTGNRQTCSRRFLLGGGYSDYKTPRGDDGILETSSSFNIVGNERETVAADVLAGICGSLSSEAMSSCITSSADPGEGYQKWKCKKVGSETKRPLTPEVTQNVDDETCSDESCGEMDPADWTDEEKYLLIQAVSSYGKDFAMISRRVRTRSRDQCKVFFSKARKCLGLDLIHPGPGNVGTPVTDDANEGGNDTEDACVVEAGSVICSNKLGFKTDEDMPMSVWNVNQDESDPGGTMNLQMDLNRSGEDCGTRELDHTGAGAVENLVTHRCEVEDRPEMVFAGENNTVTGVDGSRSEPVHIQKIVGMSADTEAGRDQAMGQGPSVEESVSAGGVINGPSRSNGVVETKALVEASADGVGPELERRELLLPENGDKQDEDIKADTSGQGGLHCSIQDSNTIGNAHQVAADTSSCSRLSISPESRHHSSLDSDHDQQPRVISLQQNSVAANSLLQDSAAIQYVKTLNQDLLSPTRDFEESKDKQCQKAACTNDHHQHLLGHPLLNHIESSQILGGYPSQIHTKEINGAISCKKPCAIQSLPILEGNFPSGQYLAQDCYLQKCNSSKSHGSVAELPLLSQKSEQTGHHPRTHLRSSSDTDKPCKNGDVKLFGQILSHPSHVQKSNSSTHQNDDKVSQQPKLSSKPVNLKFTGHHNMDGSSASPKLDRNNYLGLENLPVRSYGFWDGNQIQTGFSTLPDSAILLAKYPTAFSNFPTSSSKTEQHPLQAVVKSNERNMNGVSVFPTREINGSNGVTDYQLYRSRDGTRMQPLTVDMKQRQDMYAEMQRRNGFDAVSSLQQQGRGVVGMNVVGRAGILVPAVLDPVAAIKMHYAKTEQYGGQGGSIIRDEDAWGGKGDMGR